MSLKRNVRFALLPLTLAGLGLAAAHPVQAQTIIVQNASFENPDVTTTAPYYSNDVITDWAGTVNNSNTDFGVYAPTLSSTTFSSIPDGNQVAYINRGSIYQDTGTTLTAGQAYTLTAYVGQANNASGGGVGNISIENTSGTILGGLTGLTSTPGTFTQYSYTLYDNGQIPVGQGLRIALGIDNPGGGVVNFDKVTLTESAAPEPSQIAALGFTAFGVLGLILKARKRKGTVTAA